MAVIEKEALVKEAVLGPLAIERNDRVAEYKRRRPQLLQKRLPAAEAAKYLENGWSQSRPLPKYWRHHRETEVPRRNTRKPIVCAFFYQFGFTELNRDAPI